jgi:hypothetical protein
MLTFTVIIAISQTYVKAGTKLSEKIALDILLADTRDMPLQIEPDQSSIRLAVNEMAAA